MRVDPILQSESAECGLACLAMAAAAHGLRIDLTELRRDFPTSIQGATLDRLASNAAAIGLASRAVRLELHELGELKLPCILHWQMNHFVVLEKVTRTAAVIVDPASGRRRQAIKELSSSFTGVALELTPAPDFRRENRREKMSLIQLAGRISGLKQTLGQLVVLALLLELLSLAAPMLNQVVVDDAIAGHDLDLLSVLILGFALMALMQTVFGLARSWMLLGVSQGIALQWGANLFSHLVRLPVAFFEKRRVGDILSRFGSLGAIQSAITNRAMEAMLDGIMAAATLSMMLVYSPLLTAVVLGSIVAYVAIRCATFHAFRQAASERLVVAARENTHFIETLRAITPLKLFGREHDRLARWQNLRVDVQNRDVRTARMSLGISAAATLVAAAQNLAVLWMGAELVTSSGVSSSGSTSAFTVGMLFAFIAYKSQFTARLLGLVDFAIDFKMLDIHLERLADIAHTAPEGTRHGADALDNLQPGIELRNVSYRYGEGESWVIRHANLRIEPGECVAIIGESGCGKTTLAKIILGLIDPQDGEVLYGNVPIRQLGVNNYRKVAAAVMQDDVLLCGSIADNIAFFDLRPDADRMIECAKAAAIHDFVAAAPMGYRTIVGELGGNLSGGQRQRLLMARALYKLPRVLVLDEATSHLDEINEDRVSRAVASMRMTRVIVAHRPSTISKADKVYRLSSSGLIRIDGRLGETN